MKIQLTMLALMFCMTQSVAWGQEEARSVQTINRNYGVAATAQSPLATWLNGSTSELSKAMKLLKSAEGDEDREKAIEQLRTALDDQYDKSLENYSEYLDKLEEKVKTLREQVTRRRSAKNDLVELKLKMMINEADGLGWPDSRPTGFFMNDGRFPNSQSSNLYFPGGGPAVGGPIPTFTAPRASGQSDR